MKHSIDPELTNESGQTIDNDPEIALGLGTEEECAFKRGREWRKRGYTFAGCQSAIAGKSSYYMRHFKNGWKWQDRHQKRGH